MKNAAMIVSCLALVLAVSPFYAFGLPGQEASASMNGSGATFGDVEGKEWILAELRSGGATVTMDRQKLEADGMGAFYTINFREGQVNGVGAPNRYFGPYTSGGNRALSFGNVASTMMMAFREPDGLKEHEYFGYLSKVTRWDLRGGKLELHSADSNGSEAVLVFTMK